MDGMPETVWIRDDQNGGFELTDSGDPVACEYIRADMPDVVQTLRRQIKKSDQRAED